MAKGWVRPVVGEHLALCLRMGLASSPISVECPWCGAEVDEPCRPAKGLRHGTILDDGGFHSDRIRYHEDFLHWCALALVKTQASLSAHEMKREENDDRT